MSLRGSLGEKILLFDGAMGTMLQMMDIPAGSCPELLNLEDPDSIALIHDKYLTAGCDIIESNTFGANSLKLAARGLAERAEEINVSGVAIAKKVAKEKFVAGSLGPTGEFLEPFGTLEFSQVVHIYAEQAGALAQGGADCLIIETMMDIQEARAALLGARIATNLPVIVQMTFTPQGRTMGGTDPLTAAYVLAGMGALVTGSNCGLGSAGMVDIMEKMQTTPAFLSALPNAGMPQVENGETFYRENPQEMASFVESFIDLGVNIIGSCCGSTPEHTAALKKAIGKRPPKSRSIESGLFLAGRRQHAFIQNELALKYGDIHQDLGTMGEELVAENSLALVDLRQMGEMQTQGLKEVIDTFQINGGYLLGVAATNPADLELALSRYGGRALAYWCNEWDISPHEFLQVAKKYGAGILLDQDGFTRRLGLCSRAGFSERDLAMRTHSGIKIV